VHKFGFTLLIYYDARSTKRLVKINVLAVRILSFFFQQLFKNLIFVLNQAGDYLVGSNNDLQRSPI
jgi:hypothetical protein